MKGFVQIMTAERIVDCYDGPECDEHKAMWLVFASGDKDSDRGDGALTLDPKHFPAGTRVLVMVPACPDCECDPESCRCGFDWKKWAEDKYS